MKLDLHPYRVVLVDSVPAKQVISYNVIFLWNEVSIFKIIPFSFFISRKSNIKKDLNY